VEVQEHRDRRALDVLEQDCRKARVVGVVEDLVDDGGRFELAVDLLLDDLERVRVRRDQLIEIRP
jgi:hypothetical protein